jgi:hypothetical protein
MTDEGDFYTRSDRSRVPVRSMVYQHLVSSHAKLVRERPGHPEIAGMAREIARRNAEYAAMKTALGAFSNRLTLLLSIDRHELVEAKVIAANDTLGWNHFSSDPYRWFIGASDQAAERLWAIMEARSK